MKDKKLQEYLGNIRLHMKNVNYMFQFKIQDMTQKECKNMIIRLYDTNPKQAFTLAMTFIDAFMAVKDSHVNNFMAIITNLEKLSKDLAQDVQTNIIPIQESIPQDEEDSVGVEHEEGNE